MRQDSQITTRDATQTAISSCNGLHHFSPVWTFLRHHSVTKCLKPCSTGAVPESGTIASAPKSETHRACVGSHAAPVTLVPSSITAF